MESVTINPQPYAGVGQQLNNLYEIMTITCINVWTLGAWNRILMDIDRYITAHNITLTKEEDELMMKIKTAINTISSEISKVDQVETRTVEIVLNDAIGKYDDLSKLGVVYKYSYSDGTRLESFSNEYEACFNIDVSQVVSNILKAVPADRLFGNQEELVKVSNTFNRITGGKYEFTLYDKQITPCTDHVVYPKTIKVVIVNNTKSKRMLSDYFKENLLTRLIRRTNHYNATRNRIRKFKEH